MYIDDIICHLDSLICSFSNSKTSASPFFLPKSRLQGSSKHLFPSKLSFILLLLSFSKTKVTMFAGMKKIALLAFITGSASVSKAQATSGTGITTRYWDCCKGSCSWSGKAAVSAPVTTCDISDNPLADMNAASGCQGGPAYMCTNQSPWQVSDTLSYGFAAAKISGATEADWCCACYQ